MTHGWMYGWMLPHDWVLIYIIDVLNVWCQKPICICEIHCVNIHPPHLRSLLSLVAMATHAQPLLSAAACLFLSAHDSADLDAARWSPRSHSCCGRKEEVEQVASRSSAFVSVLAQEQIISREPSSAAAALLLLSFPHHAAPINLFCLQFAHLQVVAEQCVRCLRPL